MEKKIAFDIGGVLGPQLAERKLAGGGYAQTDPYPHALDVVTSFAGRYGRENVFVISRVGSSEQEAVNWALLEYWEFTEKTGVPSSNITIYQGPRTQKARLVKEFGINRMFDDQPEVLAAMSAEVELVAVGPKQTELDRFPELKRRKNCHIFPRDWRAIARHFHIPLSLA